MSQEFPVGRCPVSGDASNHLNNACSSLTSGGEKTSPSPRVCAYNMAKLWRVIDRGVCKERFFLLTPSAFPCPQSFFILLPGLFFFPFLSICLALFVRFLSVSPPRSACLLPSRPPSLFLSLSLSVCVFPSRWFFLLLSPTLSPSLCLHQLHCSDSLSLSLSPLPPVLMSLKHISVSDLEG